MRPYCSRPATRGIALFALLSLGGYQASAQEGAASAAVSAPPPTPPQEQPEVLSRGPVHEAFAEPVTVQLQAGLVVPVKPPPNIQEVPPPDRPQGQQYVWIPGYWGWDADKRGFIWVSACWRVAPPNMSWVPGYWSQVTEGWEWVPGFWAPAAARDIEYLPTPPPDDNVEPPGPAPSADMIWVRPCQYWSHGKYILRPGYWLAAQQDWVWVPSHYVMTPRGCVFAEGHWDYPLERRGVLFAPVSIPASVYSQPDYTYSPSIVIDDDLLQDCLFAYPRYCHYFFGDYYDDAYLSFGIYPWFECRRYGTWYDPTFENDCWRHRRNEPRWEEHERERYEHRRADASLRPSRTFREQEARLSALPLAQRGALQVAQPLASVAASRKSPIKFEQISTEARQAISKQATAVHSYRDERTRWESVSTSPRRAQTSEPRTATAAPQIERQPTVQPGREYRSTGNAPVVQREPTFVAPRQMDMRQSERVQIPSSPVVGRSSGSGGYRSSPAPSRSSSGYRDGGGADGHRR